MVGIINSWAQGIILAVIVATIIEIILPEGNNKKYVKTIIGIYILFVMVHPLISKISNKNIDINSVIETTTSKINEYEADNIAIEANSYIEETYKQKLEEDIKEKTNEKGYDINFLNLDIETENEETYGAVNAIVMKISKIEEQEETDKNITENTVNTIQSVEIKISDESTINKDKEKQDENISVEEIEVFKEYLSSVYGTQKEKVHINETN